MFYSLMREMQSQGRDVGRAKDCLSRQWRGDTREGVRERESGICGHGGELCVKENFRHVREKEGEIKERGERKRGNSAREEEECGISSSSPYVCTCRRVRKRDAA